ncbi:nitrilase-related carbon-nitrogen hydrolase [Klebsiella pneumoniae]|uniref:nitrilase-related carbon-nitrogen hydrolase n=1 Tax=Klebsiella pneumoniae TaxID=573 RepID=UPI00280B150C|nr:nitrilase-related carbon-nitrogen hydrolase [Klebsiella pneumoniae]
MAESRIIRAAAAQIAPDLHEASRTLARVLEAIDEAAEQGAEIIVFPETFVPYYPYFSFITPAISAGAAHLKLYEQAVVVPGPITCAVGGRPGGERTRSRHALQYPAGFRCQRRTGAQAAQNHADLP